MSKNKVELMAEGKRFEPKKSSGTVDGDWVMLKAGFDSDRIAYYVMLEWEGDLTTEYFTSRFSAVVQYADLKSKYNLS